MKESLQKSYKEWKLSWQQVLHDQSFWRSAIWGLVLFGISVVAATFANTYASAHAGAPVGDIILSNIPTMNVYVFYVYGPIVLLGVAVFALIRWPKEFPLAIKVWSIFVLIRSVAICLTHLGLPAGEIIPAHIPSLFKRYFFGGDLFFSGHVGMPLIIGFAFWTHKWFRVFLIASAVFLGVIVLIGHYHYSIDVFAAVFITPFIFQIACKMFPKDYKRARNS